MTQSFKPGEVLLARSGEITANNGRKTNRIIVKNLGDRPVQVGSHFHFFEVNKYLEFPRKEAFGKRLNIPAGTAVRFEPGDEKEIELVEISGKKMVFGLNALTQGKSLPSALGRAKSRGFRGV
jgi:urease beta subunit